MAKVDVEEGLGAVVDVEEVVEEAVVVAGDGVGKSANESVADCRAPWFGPSC